MSKDNRDLEVARDIQAEIANLTGIAVERINGKERTKAVLDARQLCMWFIKDKTSLNQWDIAAIMNKRTHGPVHHGLKKFRDVLDVNPGFRNRIAQIRARLEHIK